VGRGATNFPIGTLFLHCTKRQDLPPELRLLQLYPFRSNVFWFVPEGASASPRQSAVLPFLSHIAFETNLPLCIAHKCFNTFSTIRSIRSMRSEAENPQDKNFGGDPSPRLMFIDSINRIRSRISP
jgi:hypothetical protein